MAIERVDFRTWRASEQFKLERSFGWIFRLRLRTYTSMPHYKKQDKQKGNMWSYQRFVHY